MKTQTDQQFIKRWRHYPARRPFTPRQLLTIGFALGLLAASVAWFVLLTNFH